MDKRIKPLVLRLTDMQKDKMGSIEQQENSLVNQMEELRKVAEKQLQEVQDRVLACRPKGKKHVDNTAEGKAYERLLIVVTRIIEDMQEVLTTISYRQRLFVHQIMLALTRDGDRKAVKEELEKDINYQLKRWDTYLERIEEYLQME